MAVADPLRNGYSLGLVSYGHAIHSPEAGSITSK
jgi:hypothetical protein